MGHRSRFVPVGVAADLLGISHNSVRNFCKRGELDFVTSMGGHRRVSLKSINLWLGLDEETDSNRKVVFYARVSGKIQRQQGNLARQAERLESYCVNELGEAKENIIGIQEQGSGLSETRPGYIRLLDLVISGQIKYLVCEDRDRLARYGVVVLENLCHKFNVELIITNQKQEISEDEEMTSDILSICSVFAARRHGRRGTKRTEMPLTEKVRNRIVELYLSGHSQTAISEILQSESHTCQNTGKLFKRNAVRKALKEYHQRNAGSLKPEGANSLQRFLDESCVVGGLCVYTRPLFRAYREWCKKRGFNSPTSRAMTMRIKGMGFEIGKNGYGFCLIKGLTLKGNPRASMTHLAE